MEKHFKGGKFFNRYRITGRLIAESPLHIGNGEMASNPARMPRTDESEEAHKFTTVMADISGRAYIPGSTLKGNLRAWLTQLLSDFNLACVNDSDREKTLFEMLEESRGADKAEVYKKLHENLMMAEYLFGSNANEGKLEFWDAAMAEPPVIDSADVLAYSGYDGTRGTILLRSVAIDPKKGTAARNKLYNYEVVPQGAAFQLTVAGQNLCDAEIGMLLFALDGFNSFIYPVTLGAMGSVGMGRFCFEFQDIRCLNRDNFQSWITDAVQNGHAGYENLPLLSEQARKKRIQEFKESFLEQIR